MNAAETTAIQAPAVTVDAKGLNCPLPILRAKKALAGLETGQIVVVLSTDPGSKADFTSFCKQTGNELLSSGEAGGAFEYTIRKN